jgi:hypothetical protein
VLDNVYPTQAVSIVNSRLIQLHAAVESPHSFMDDDFRFDSILMECLISFFRWQNPSISFFDEKQFMDDMACTKQTRGSISTIYAAGAIGALTAQRREAQDMSQTYMQLCESYLSLQHVTAESSAVEASLLCAVYFAGQNDLTKSALYHGKICLRMCVADHLLRNRSRIESLPGHVTQRNSRTDQPACKLSRYVCQC